MGKRMTDLSKVSIKDMKAEIARRDKTNTFDLCNLSNWLKGSVKSDPEARIFILDSRETWGGTRIHFDNMKKFIAWASPYLEADAEDWEGEDDD